MKDLERLEKILSEGDTSVLGDLGSEIKRKEDTDLLNHFLPLALKNIKDYDEKVVAIRTRKLEDILSFIVKTIPRFCIPIVVVNNMEGFSAYQSEFNRKIFYLENKYVTPTQHTGRATTVLYPIDFKIKTRGDLKKGLKQQVKILFSAVQNEDITYKNIKKRKLNTFTCTLADFLIFNKEIKETPFHLLF